MSTEWRHLKKVLLPSARQIGTAVVILILFAGSALAFIADVGEGKPFTLQGYLTQGVGYGVAGDQYDTKSGFQSFLTQFTLETSYEPRKDTRIFLSGKYNADQAYPVFSNNNQWTEKRFDKSRSRLGWMDDWQDVLGEAHITWQPGNLFLRIGKQIVGWGETDGIRLMDQINPLDQRRGITDVQFENTIIPVWMIRADYRETINSSWLQDIAFQFIFNPSAQFRGNENLVPGNDRAGIWAPNVEIPLGGPYPSDFAHLGSLRTHIDKPGDFSSKGFKYAARIMANAWDSRITLNGFYGRDNDYVTRNLPLPPFMEVSPFDQRLIIHPEVEGYYPLLKFVGATFTKDLDFLRSSSLGGVAPVIRSEAFYAFNSTFTNNLNAFEKFDEFRWAIGMDWKVKIPLLNPKSGFSLSAQVFDRKIIDYPDYGIAGIRENNWQTTFSVTTSYFNAKVSPLFFWQRDWSNRGNLFLYAITYDPNDTWKYKIGAFFVDGEKTGKGFEPVKHKDHLFFNVTYKF